MVAVQFKYVLLMIIIAVLFSIFTHSLGQAVMEEPKYADFCNYQSEPYERDVEVYRDQGCPGIAPSQEAVSACIDQEGSLRGIKDEQGCITTYACETCHLQYDEAEERFSLNIFLFMSIIGILAIIISLVVKKEGVMEWILNGFLLGGLISLFVGTIIYFEYASRIMRPLIMLVEIIIVIAVAFFKMETKGKRKKR